MSVSITDLKSWVAYNFELDMHPSFYEKIFPECLQPIQRFTNPCLRHKLQIFAVNKLQLLAIPPELLKHPYSKLLQYTSSKWLYLKKALGAIYCTQEIKQIIQNQQQNEISTFLSPELYHWVLHQGPLYMPLFSELENPYQQEESLVTKIDFVGKFLLEYLWTQQPESLQQRFTLKFSKNEPWNFRHVIDPNLQIKIYNLTCRFAEQYRKD